jgi:S-DNA-T family DNA segregation ATPase FtsK/SpoIIIE
MEKGGGMAACLKGLPHVAGIITNLDGNETRRALASLGSEIRRRQSIFRDLNIWHIDAYTELCQSRAALRPLPHLIIVADEFAELKKEQPDFVRDLVSASAWGAAWACI